MIGYVRYIDGNKMSFKVTNKKTVQKVYHNMGEKEQFNEKRI